MTAFPFYRLAVIGVLTLSFALTACGRRGPLDPPPRAQASPQQQGQPQQNSAAENPDDEEGTPPMPRGEKKRFFLDWLLN